MELKIEYLPIKALKPYEKNTRKHQKKDVDNIAKSIEKYGMCDAIGIWGEDNIIVEGHGRMMACKQLGMNEVPCVRLDHLTDEQRREYAIAHNATAELSEWDLDILPDELAELDLGDFDFDFGIEDEEEETEIVEDEAPEVDEDAEPIAKLGDIWQLGRHRLMCGDSTDKATVGLLMNGNKADMVFTDPPYGVSYEGGLNEKKKQQIKNDSITGNDLYYFLCDVFANAKLNTKDKSAIYVFYATKTTKEFINAFIDSGLKQRGIIAWYKQGGGFGDFMAHYMNAYEPCIYGSNGESVNWYGASNEKTVWEINKEKKCDLHPTMKPIEVVARAIRNSSAKGNTVLDLFGGSGSTLIACEQLDRTCYMMELDPKYCDVIIKRWETLTGEKAVLIND